MESVKTITFVRRIGRSCRVLIPTPLQEDLRGRVVKITIEVIK